MWADGDRRKVRRDRRQPALYRDRRDSALAPEVALFDRVSRSTAAPTGCGAYRELAPRLGAAR